MISADLQRRVNQTPRLKAVAFAIMLMGIAVIAGAFIVSIAVGISTADFFENAASVRDSAAPDDPATRGILSQEGTIAAVSAWVAPLRFVGVVFLLTGISTFFFVIISSIRLRGEAMRDAFPIILGTDGADR